MEEAKLKRNPKLHELLAVRTSLKAQAASTQADLENTFEKKQHHFTARVKSFTPAGENAETKVEDVLELQTSVKGELRWIKGFMAKAMDSHLHIAEGNTKAFADIVLEGGMELARAVPASTLLDLETSIEDLRKFAAKIPTLDPAKGFKLDPDRGEGVYVARDVEKVRTQMVKKIYTLYPATDKHPAQTQLLDEQVPIGTIREREWSSMLTPAQKAEILDRIEKLARAVKKARARANEVEVDTTHGIGGVLLTYALGV